MRFSSLIQSYHSWRVQSSISEITFGHDCSCPCARSFLQVGCCLLFNPWTCNWQFTYPQCFPRSCYYPITTEHLRKIITVSTSVMGGSVTIVFSVTSTKAGKSSCWYIAILDIGGLWSPQKTVMLLSWIAVRWCLRQECKVYYAPAVLWMSCQFSTLWPYFLFLKNFSGRHEFTNTSTKNLS